MFSTQPMKKLYLTFTDLICLAGFAATGNQKFFIPAVFRLEIYSITSYIISSDGVMME